MKNITLTADFFLGGKATFTVQNNTSGEHRTYKIRKPEPTPQYPNPTWFIKVMSGTDNENHYKYVGKVHAKAGFAYINGVKTAVPAGFVELTRASKFAAGSPVLTATRWVADRVINQTQIPDCIDIRHSGKCGRCGRTLTTPESLDRGIGPECWSIMGH